MADVTAVTSWHGTLPSLVAVQRVALTMPTCPWVTVTNRGGTEAYVRFDGTDPAVGADGCYVVLAGGTRTFGTGNYQTNLTVGLISTVAVAVSVEGALLNGLV